MALKQENASVIICAYTEDRWDDLTAAVESVRRQRHPAHEIVVVIDHNVKLMERVRAAMPDVRVFENREQRGLSGARNTGIAQTRGSFVAFLDDDAVADPDWLERLVSVCRDSAVLGSGGLVRPDWQSGKPSWFPEEFNWVVGCSYRGLPEEIQPVRNLIGASMCIRRSVFDEIGYFRPSLGRIGKYAAGCEETELCIRARQRWPGCDFIHEPNAKVSHHVPKPRATWRYFCERCYTEGLSKAAVVRYVTANDGLMSERAYTLRTLPLGVARGVADSVRRFDLTGLLRAGAIIAGLLITTAGYLVGTARRASASLTITPDQGQAESEQLQRDAVRHGHDSPTLLSRSGFAPSHTSSRVSTPRYAGKQRKTLMPQQTVAPRAGASNDRYEPMQVETVEIGHPLPLLSAHTLPDGRLYQRARLLTQLHGHPLGVVDVSLDHGDLTPEACAEQIWNGLHAEILAHLAHDRLPSVDHLDGEGLPRTHTLRCGEERSYMLAHAPSASVVICTRDHPQQLRRCLDAVLSQHYPAFEIVVIDNAPHTTATLELVRNHFADVPNLRYFLERRPGLSVARNRGIMEARGSIVAFTDDDTIPSPQWLTSLVTGFDAAEDVACVTGLAFPFALDTPAQFWFEEFGGFNKGYSRRIFRSTDAHPDTPLHPYTAGRFGTGANMAFTARFLREMNGFDAALGAGSLARGGEDLDAFFQALARGHTLVYEPDALLYHEHRPEYAALRQQIYDAGRGLVAYLTKIVAEDKARLIDIAGRLPYGMYFAFSPRSPKNAHRSATYPRELAWIEVKGMLTGPIAYARADWRKRLAGGSHPPSRTGGPAIHKLAQPLEMTETR